MYNFKLRPPGMFYYVLGNIRPQLQSTCRIVQLIACVECPTLGKYGFEKVLEPFIEDVNTLCDVCAMCILSGTCFNLYHNYCLLFKEGISVTVSWASSYIPWHCFVNAR